MSRIGQHTDAVHLAPSPMAASHLRTLLAELGRRDEVVEFDDAWQLGPLSDVDEHAALRDAWWQQLTEGIPGYEQRPSFDDSDRWRRIEADDRPVVLWHGPHPAEYLFALRACERLRARPRRLHEVRLHKIRGCRPWLPSFYRAVALCAGELHAAWAAHTRVADVTARAARWRTIRARPSAWVRELQGEAIRHAPISAFDSQLVSAAGGAGRRSVSVIGSVLNDFPLNDVFLIWRVRELVASGRLEGRGPLDRLGLPEEIRDPKLRRG